MNVLKYDIAPGPLFDSIPFAEYLHSWDYLTICVYGIYYTNCTLYHSVQQWNGSHFDTLYDLFKGVQTDEYCG